MSSETENTISLSQMKESDLSKEQIDDNEMLPTAGNQGSKNADKISENGTEKSLEDSSQNSSKETYLETTQQSNETKVTEPEKIEKNDTGKTVGHVLYSLTPLLEVSLFLLFLSFLFALVKM